MHVLRCCLVGSAATLAAAAALRLLMPSVLGGADGFESGLVRVCAGVACVCAVWGWLAALAVVFEALRWSERAAPRMPGVPPGLRRLVLAACGVALTATAAPAFASPALVSPAADTTHTVPAAVAGLPFPARAMDQPTDAVSVLVRPGDSLWGISARHLPSEAADAEIASAWRELYATNRDVLGDDPSLIHPGQRLELPDRLEEPS